MKEADRVEPTVMRLALSLHTLGFLPRVAPPISSLLEDFTFSFFQVDHYSVFFLAKACLRLS